MEQKNKETNFISAVLYLDRQELAGAFLNMVYRVLDGHFHNYEIICVLDTADASISGQIRDFKKDRDVTVTVIHMGFWQGVEACMNAGVDLSIGDYVFQFDSCRMDYDEQTIMDAYEQCMQGYDIVSARLPGSECKLSSRIFYKIYNHYSDAEYDLATETFCIISRRAVNRVAAYSRIIPYRKAVYAESGLRLMDMEYQPVAKARNKSRPEKSRISLATDAIVLFTDAAYHISLFFSAMMVLVMFGFGIFTTVSYFVNKRVVAGWSPLMGLVSLGFLSPFVLLAFMFKYLEIITKLIFRKQKYAVQSVEKIG